MENKHFSNDDQQLLEQLMLHRRDVRGNNFLPDEVPDDVIDRILHSASLAPSVGYSQPWEFVVIRDTAVKARISASFELENEKAAGVFAGEKKAIYSHIKLEGIHEAPVNIAVFYKPEKGPVLGQNTMLEAGEYSVVCAVQNMWLMSRALNIGLGWVSILDPLVVKDILNSPPDNKLVAYLCIGYVGEFFSMPELERLQWKSRKPLEASVYREGYPARKRS
ncbi:MAG: 5,6-dimethylbenzimidazole synthase [Candidatus Azotimanducaceae bacterium]|jgi:5,6-dimethylbenzimidazole synthase